jgi:hypothetical protein
MDELVEVKRKSVRGKKDAGKPTLEAFGDNPQENESGNIVFTVAVNGLKEFCTPFVARGMKAPDYVGEGFKRGIALDTGCHDSGVSVLSNGCGREFVMDVFDDIDMVMSVMCYEAFEHDEINSFPLGGDPVISIAQELDVFGKGGGFADTARIVASDGAVADTQVCAGGWQEGGHQVLRWKLRLVFAGKRVGINIELGFKR